MRRLICRCLAEQRASAVRAGLERGGRGLQLLGGLALGADVAALARLRIRSSQCLFTSFDEIVVDVVSLPTAQATDLTGLAGDELDRDVLLAECGCDLRGSREGDRGRRRRRMCLLGACDRRA